MSVSAGEAYVTISCDNSSLERGLQEVAAKINETSRIVSSSEPNLTPKIKIDPRPVVDALKEINDATRAAEEQSKGYSAVLAITFGDIFSAIKSFGMGVANILGEAGDQYDKMSQRVGVSTSALSEYAHAANMCGANISNVEGALRQMSAVSLNASNGIAEAKAAFNRLGIDIESFQRLSPEEQFDLIADHITKIEDPTRRAGEAMRIFGSDGQKLLPLFSSGKQGLAEMREEARRLGISIDDSAAKMGANFVDASTRLKESIRGVGLTIADAITPAITSFLNGASRAISAVTEWARENPILSKSIITVVGAVVGCGASLAAARNAVISLVGAYNRMKGVILGVNAAMGGLNAVVTLGMTAYAAAAAAIVAMCVQMKSAADAANSVKTEMQDALAAGNAQRETDKSELEELEALRRKQAMQKLSTEEILRAVEIVANLKAKYGEVGYAVDAVTGKITAAAGAQDKLNKKMLEDKKRQLDAAIKEKQANLDTRAIDKEMADKEVGLPELILGKQRGTMRFNAIGMDRKKYGYDSDDDVIDDKSYKAWMLEEDEGFQTRLNAAREKEQAEVDAMKTERDAIEEALKALEEPVENPTPVSNITEEDVKSGFEKTAGFVSAGAEDLRSEIEKQIDSIHAEAEKLRNELKALIDPEGAVDWSKQESVDSFLKDNPQAQQLYDRMSEISKSEEAQIQKARDADAKKQEDARAKKEAEEQKKRDDVEGKIKAMEKEQWERDASELDKSIARINEQTAAYKEQLQTLLDLERAKGENADQKLITEIETKMSNADETAKKRIDDEQSKVRKEEKAKEDAGNQKVIDAFSGLVEKFGTPFEKLELAQKNLARATAALRDAQASGDKEQIAAALTRLGDTQSQYLDAMEASKGVERSMKSLGGTFDAWQATSLTRQASYEKKTFDESRQQTRYLEMIARNTLTSARAVFG